MGSSREVAGGRPNWAVVSPCGECGQAGGGSGCAKIWRGSRLKLRWCPAGWNENNPTIPKQSSYNCSGVTGPVGKPAAVAGARLGSLAVGAAATQGLLAHGDATNVVATVCGRARAVGAPGSTAGQDALCLHFPWRWGCKAPHACWMAAAAPPLPRRHPAPAAAHLGRRLGGIQHP